MTLSTLLKHFENKDLYFRNMTIDIFDAETGLYMTGSSKYTKERFDTFKDSKKKVTKWYMNMYGLQIYVA